MGTTSGRSVAKLTHKPYPADRIKNTLIKNAKLKKQYAKVKAQEEKASRTASGEPDESMSAGSTQESDEAMSTDEDDKAEDLASPMEVDANRKRYRKPDPSRMQEDSPGSMRPKLKKRKSGEMLEVTVDSVEDGEETIAPAPGPDRPAAESSAPPFVHPSRRSDASKGKSREIQPQEPKRKRQRLSEKEVDARREKREADKRAWAKKGKTGQPHMVGVSHFFDHAPPDASFREVG